MEYQIPKQGEIYKHFKGNLYEVLAVAKHTETMEDMVVYKDAEGENVYVRPLSMFVNCFELQDETPILSILDFLDCNTATEKIQYLETMKESLTEDFIGLVAQCMDFIENDGTLNDRYHELIKYLKTLERYEIRR